MEAAYIGPQCPQDRWTDSEILPMKYLLFFAIVVVPIAGLLVMACLNMAGYSDQTIRRMAKLNRKLIT